MIDLAALDKHERIALAFSGGKDSLACIYMLRGHLDRVLVIHNDTGDLLPEVMEVVEHVKAMCPNFLHIRGDVLTWQREHGLPTDILPFSASDVGRMVGQEHTKLTPRYTCCARNLMQPVHDAILAYAPTLVIRGTKAVDFPTLPVESGDVVGGIEYLHPLEGWSHAEVFEYLRREGAPISRIYEEGLQAPECSRCTAWLNVGQADYLMKYHPERAAEYKARLHAVWREVDPSLVNLASELRKLG
jgi:3'-phosphoadenosine 5'-phosphosulfate sulfotransferase (PAPS reductase)/FAD synthetase